MANYISAFEGQQIDEAVGLITGKDLNEVQGIVERTSTGFFRAFDTSWISSKSETISNIFYDTTNKKIKKTINGTTTEVISIDTIATDLGKGAANGIAPLNSSTKIDAIYLPSYVDDVLEYNGINSFPVEGETGKIYVDISTNLTYRWSGTTYVEISPGTVVTVTRNLTTGTKSATIGINGTNYDLYSMTPPTKVSQLTNDSGFINEVTVSSSGSGNVVTGLTASGDTITYNLGDVVPITRTINSKPLSSDVILKISDLTNDSGFINSISVSSSGSGNVVTGLSVSGDTITYTLGNVSTNAAQIIRNNSTTDISTLKIHYLTQAEYETALANNQINENELYFTPEQ